jgi:hypothetical protein
VTVAEEVEGEAGTDVPMPPASPYVGLVPFEEHDARFFFGRAHESAVVAANLRSRRLTLLYGPSGVGKSSLLQAGLLPSLRRGAETSARSRFAVCALHSWLDEPARRIEQSAQAALQELAGDEPLPLPSATLTESLRAWTDQAGTLLIVLDQFEEYFQYHPDEGGGETLTGFAGELARIVNDSTLRAHVLISIREDAWSKLDRFKGHVPSLFANYLHVDNLDLDAAREAIEGPINAWNELLPTGAEEYSIEGGLTATVVRDVARRDLDFTAGSDALAVSANAVQGPDDRVKAPFLQLVLERLWSDAIEGGAHTLTLARLEMLGGVQGIVESHLARALALLTTAEQNVASDCFAHLVSSSRTKYAVPAADLAGFARLTEPQVIAVLDKLCTGEGGRVLRAVAPTEAEGSPSYELFHDVLAEPVLAWRRNHEEKRRRRVRRRRYSRKTAKWFAVIALFALVITWTVRQVGRSSTAVRALGIHTELTKALQFAPIASRDGRLIVTNVPGYPGSEAVWDSATGRRLHTLPGFRGSTSIAVFSRDGKVIVTAGGDGRVRVSNATAGRSVHTLSGHTSFASGSAFGPDGKLILISDQDGAARVWNATTGRILHTFRSPTGNFATAVFSPNGKLVLTTDYSGTTQVRDAITGRIIRTLSDPTRSPSGGVFTPNGKLIVTVSDIGTSQIWVVRAHNQLGRAATR